MAEDKPSLHIDLDWKKQAQEEKKRLEEEEKKRAAERAAAQAVPAPAGVVPSAVTGSAAAPTAPGAAAATRGGRARGQQGARELPPASVESLVQSLATQIAFYLSDLAAQRGDDASNMDMAKHLIDTLGVLEQKTANNLTPEEQSFLDTALYETRMRFINTASQVIAGA
jgi:hypothetical protein